MQNVFDRKPKWPTLRGGSLTKGSLRRLQELPGVTMFAQGYHRVNEYATGGMGPGGEPKEYPALSFELQRYVRRNGSDRRTPLYLLCWVGAYSHGSIVHLGWQYPHQHDFKLEHIVCEALHAYRDVVEAVYGDREQDPDVQQFIARVCNRY
jgi:hypothetical protein